jgi:hypothetical protein
VYCDTEPYSAGKVARYFIAASVAQAVHLPVSPELGRPEHHEFRWVEHADAQRLLPPRLQPVLAWARDVIGERAGQAGSWPADRHDDPRTGR